MAITKTELQLWKIILIAVAGIILMLGGMAMVIVGGLKELQSVTTTGASIMSASITGLLALTGTVQQTKVKSKE